MQLLVPAATVALITALALSPTSPLPIARPFLAVAGSTSLNTAAISRTPIFTAPIFTAPITAAPITAAPITAAPVTPARTDNALATITPVSSGAIFAWPLSPRPVVSRRFDRPRDVWSPGHRGVDLLAAAGQPVLSAGEGIVSFSGVIAGRGVITVRHAGGLRTTYQPLDERLTTGTLVHRGSTIGVLSSTPGHCSPLHCLHWGAISGQTYRDPLSLLGLGRPVLLPLG